MENLDKKLEIYRKKRNKKYGVGTLLSFLKKETGTFGVILDEQNVLEAFDRIKFGIRSKSLKPTSK